ncbi:MAG: anthranilate synthase component I [Desulfuromonadaceae bacterium]|nr:anthranilate synthase component I [Desulfuromonadaceae bacterium]
MNIYPAIAEFECHAQRGNLVPVYTEILADMETPVSAFKKIEDHKWSFLLESVEGGEKWGRYSILGAGPATIYRSRGCQYEILREDTVVESGQTDDPLDSLRTLLKQYVPSGHEALPRFFGGAVGYLGYDMVRFVEKLPDANPGVIDTYDSCFILADNLLIFDNQRQKIKIIHNTRINDSLPLEAQYQQATQAIRALVDKLRAPLHREIVHPADQSSVLEGNFTRPAFIQAVERAKEYVRSGDIIQVVLSQRFSGPLTVDPFDIYRSLRTINPSPYMFYLRMDHTLVVGASPEVLVRKEDDQVELRPIAGTRPRGNTPEEDLRLEKELLADPKELAEHIMLVDLGRNDLGRICRPGTVEVSELKVIERYSHVMHIVSNVRGKLEGDRDAFDTFRATFPAGTLSGAPKIRAMEIIDELEPQRREIYGGAVGYFSFTGNMDLAIAIRTLVVKDGQVHLQAGAGVVADSDPQAEYEETLNKARGVMKAIEMAEKGLY